MIYIFGDSHAFFNFKNTNTHAIHYSSPSMTMHRIGRDNIIVNFKTEFNDQNSIFVFNYGEVDCRCNIGKQVLSGRDVNEVCKSLVDNYINTIKKNVINYKSIIIVAVIPPITKIEFENNNGPIEHEYPFVGSDKDRLSYHKLVNKTLESICIDNGFVFFDPFDFYTNSDGFLIQSLSDKQVHIGDNSKILELFNIEINKINEHKSS